MLITCRTFLVQSGEVTFWGQEKFTQFITGLTGLPPDVLQAGAEYMARAGLEAGESLTFFHVLGTSMIEEDLDGAGKGGARRIIGRVCSPSTREAN